MLTSHVLALTLLAAGPLGPGDHHRSVEVNGLTRSYLVHVPPQYDPRKPTPVVLVFHGGLANAKVTVGFTGMSEKADRAGFIAVYPNGSGLGEAILVWNAGMVRGKVGEKLPDDVAFVSKLLDDLESAVKVDKRRVYATGISNGGMMCYCLAAELSDRIAAIAPVGGTMAIDTARPKRPVPIIHFHGTADTFVPFTGPKPTMPKFMTFQSVDATIAAWTKLDGCPSVPKATKLPDVARDGTTVARKLYGPGKDGAEVVLYVIEGGGHTWPGRVSPLKGLGKSTKNITANDLIWEFFEKHPMPAKRAR